MKTSIRIVILICVVATGANAQTGKGSFMIGGSAGLQRSAYTYANGISGSSPLATFTISPTVGYFVMNNLAVGVQGSYTYHWSLGKQDIKGNTASIGPIVRYYIPVGKISLFSEIGASFARTREHYLSIDPDLGTQYSVTAKATQKAYRAGIGAVWFATPNIGIEGILGYKYTEYDQAAKTMGNLLYLNFGIQFYLPKRIN